MAAHGEVHSDDIVIVGVVSFGDNDAIVRCFARNAGRVSAFARGARSSRKRSPRSSSTKLGNYTREDRPVPRRRSHPKSCSRSRTRVPNLSFGLHANCMAHCMLMAFQLLG